MQWRALQCEIRAANLMADRLTLESALDLVYMQRYEHASTVVCKVQKVVVKRYVYLLYPKKNIWRKGFTYRLTPHTSVRHTGGYHTMEMVFESMLYCSPWAQTTPLHVSSMLICRFFGSDKFESLLPRTF